MALSDEIISKWFKESVLKFDLDKTFQEVEDTIEQAAKLLAEERGLYKPEDVKTYIQGSYLNNVYVGQNTKLEVVVELTRAGDEVYDELEYFMDKSPRKRAVRIKPAYPLQRFKLDLYNKLSDLFNSNRVTTCNQAITIEKNLTLPVTIEVTPAFSFKRANDEGEDVPCVLVWEEFSGDYTISYPHLHTTNLSLKDGKTDGNTKKVIRLFKNMRDYMINEQVFPAGAAPGYFIDCLVYNVPDILLKGSDMRGVLLKVFNYLNNKNINEMLCVHEQFPMFGSNFDQWDIKHARFFVSSLIYTYKNIKE